MVKANDIATIYQVGNRWAVDIWTVNGEPFCVGTWPLESTAKQAANAIAHAVRGWMEEGR